MLLEVANLLLSICRKQLIRSVKHTLAPLIRSKPSTLSPLPSTLPYPTQRGKGRLGIHGIAGSSNLSSASCQPGHSGNICMSLGSGMKLDCWTRSARHRRRQHHLAAADRAECQPGRGRRNRIADGCLLRQPVTAILRAQRHAQSGLWRNLWRDRVCCGCNRRDSHWPHRATDRQGRPRACCLDILLG